MRELGFRSYGLAFEPPNPPAVERRQEQAELLAEFIATHSGKLLLVTGAGLSTESRLPDYRSPQGAYSLGHKPITYLDFTQSLAKRQRYWLRSWAGFSGFLAATPNPGHEMVAAMERAGLTTHTITQNVDRLHHRAGSERVLELHGNLFQVVCLQCRATVEREAFQEKLAAGNPLLQLGAAPAPGQVRPDGDVDLGQLDPSQLLCIPTCACCGGLMKPNVVLFGESIPADVVQHSFALVEEADAVLCLGTSLQVFSAFRLVRRATERSIPVAAVSIGPTRADDVLSFKVEDRCGEIMPLVMKYLSSQFLYQQQFHQL